MSARGSSRWAAAAAAVAIGVVACSTLRDDRGTPHASQTRRLPQLMRDLETLSYARLPQAMDLSQERARRLRKLERVASAIADSAAQLEDAGAAEPFSPAERLVFAGHAATLERRAEFLARNAESLTSEELRAGVAAIEETCAGCHRSLRGAPPTTGEGG